MIQVINPILKPNNIVRYLDFEIEDIVVGGTTIHTFNVPLKEEDVSSFNIIYGYGIDVAINKSNGDRGVVITKDKDGNMIITCTLEPEETLKFGNWYRDATVQLKFVLNGNTTEYSDIYYLRVLKTLDNK